MQKPVEITMPNTMSFQMHPKLGKEQPVNIKYKINFLYTVYETKYRSNITNTVVKSYDFINVKTFRSCKSIR